MQKDADFIYAPNQLVINQLHLRSPVSTLAQHIDISDYRETCIYLHASTQ